MWFEVSNVADRFKKIKANNNNNNLSIYMAHISSLGLLIAPYIILSLVVRSLMYHFNSLLSFTFIQ